MLRLHPDSQIKKVVIAGGAGALGQQIACCYLREGAEVVIADIDEARGAQFVADTADLDGKAHYLHLNVCEPESWLTLRAELQRRWAQLDVLVYAAGHAEVNDYAEAAVENHFRVLNVNLTGAMAGCHALLPWLSSNTQPSSLVLVASYAGFLTMPWSASYNASKAGLIAFGESLQSEFDSVDVTIACPAFFHSPLFERAEIDHPALNHLVGRLVDTSPLTAESVAAAIHRGASRRKLYVIVPAGARWIWRFKRWYPRTFTRRLGRKAKLYRAKAQAAADQAHQGGNP